MSTNAGTGARLMSESTLMTMLEHEHALPVGVRLANIRQRGYARFQSAQDVKSPDFDKMAGAVRRAPAAVQPVNGRHLAQASARHPERPDGVQGHKNRE